MKRLGWIWVTFVALGILSLVNLALSYFLLINPTIVMIEKVIGVLFLFLLIPAFRTHKYYLFQDADLKYLATVEVSKNNMSEMLAAIQLIKQKTVLISEADLTAPFPTHHLFFKLENLIFLIF